ISFPSLVCVLLSTARPPRMSPLFPYTTLFRSSVPHSRRSRHNLNRGARDVQGENAHVCRVDNAVLALECGIGKHSGDARRVLHGGVHVTVDSPSIPSHLWVLR